MVFFNDKHYFDQKNGRFHFVVFLSGKLNTSYINGPIKFIYFHKLDERIFVSIYNIYLFM